MIGVVESVGHGRFRVPTPGGSRVVASRTEVARWVNQVGGDGYHWADVLARIDALGER